MKKRKVKGVVHSRYTSAGNKIRKTKRMGKGAKLTLIIVITVLVSVTFAIILGNLLNAKSGDADKYFSTVEPIKVDGNLSLGKAPSVKSHSVTLGENISFENGEYTAVSFFVNGDDGVLYASSVAEHFGRDNGSETDLAQYVSYAKNAGYYTTACFKSGFLGIDNDARREAESLYEEGLIAEIASCGVDEIVVFFDGADASNFSQMREFLRAVKLKSPDVILGVRLGVTDMEDQNAWAEISNFSQVCDFAALDIRELELSENGGESARFVASMRFYLLNYNVRILFDSENESQKSFIYGMKITNWSIFDALMK